MRSRTRCPTAKGRRRCASTMASRRKATTGMSSPPVARGSDASGRMTRACSGPASCAARGAAEVQRHRRHHERRQAEEDPGVTQAVVRPDLARYSRHRHQGQIGQEAPRSRVGRGRGTSPRAGARAERVVGVLASEEVLAAHLDGDHLWLLVGACDTVEAPEDLEPQRNGEAPGEHADGDQDPRRPRPAGAAVWSGHGRAAAAGRAAPAMPTRPMPRRRRRTASTAIRPQTWYHAFVDV